MRATPRVVIGIRGGIIPKGWFLFPFAAFGLFIVVIPTGKYAFEYYITYQKYYQSVHIFWCLSGWLKCKGNKQSPYWQIISVYFARKNIKKIIAFSLLPQIEKNTGILPLNYRLCKINEYFLDIVLWNDYFCHKKSKETIYKQYETDTPGTF